MLNVNTHVHSPYSFSSFDSIEQCVSLAKEENLAVLGINDFNTTEGYTEFWAACEEYGIYPLFNIEFITLSEYDKLNGLRWNDPRNPGMCYLCGKGLQYPVTFSNDSKNLMASIWKGTQDRIWRMIGRINDHLQAAGIDICLNYNEIRNQLAKSSVRERHLAKALYIEFVKKWSDPNALAAAFKKLFNDPSFEADLSDSVLMQNEIRSRLLKAGMVAYVDESNDAFLGFEEAKNFILEAGGIPCYPLLADETIGLTEHEKNIIVLTKELQEKSIHAVEFLPYRTSFNLLKTWARHFYDNGFCVTFGTEHNTPERISLIPAARGGIPFDEEMEKIAYEGACIIAAHQELHRQSRTGFVDECGRRVIDESQMKSFRYIGDEVIRRTYQKTSNELNGQKQLR